MSAATRGPQSLARSLSELLSGMGVQGKMKEFEAIASWPAIVGDSVAEVTKPVRVSHGILFVQVKNSVWRSELVYMKAEILANITRQIGENVIDDIKYI